jgi:DnaD/phage-associated family protein
MVAPSTTRQGLVPLPPGFVERHLVHITNIVELKVTLHLCALVVQQRSQPRRVSWELLVADPLMRQSLMAVAPHSNVEDVLAEGLAAAVQRGSVLHVVQSDKHGRAINWYLVRTDANDAWATARDVSTTDEPVVVREVPSLVGLYEQHLGIVTPFIVAELKRAELQYPSGWIEEAMREAVVANVRSWRYVSKILQRWASQGRGNRPTDSAPAASTETIDADRYTSGAYGDLFRRGSDTSDLEPMS